MKKCMKVFLAIAAFGLVVSPSGCKKKEKPATKESGEAKGGKAGPAGQPAAIKHARFVPAGAVAYGVISGKELIDAARPLIDAIAKKEGKASVQAVFEKAKKEFGVDLNAIGPVTLIGVLPKPGEKKSIFFQPVFILEARVFAKGQHKPAGKAHGIDMYHFKSSTGVAVVGGSVLIGPRSGVEKVLAAKAGKSPRMKGDARLLGLLSKLRKHGAGATSYVVADVAGIASAIKAQGKSLGKLEKSLKAAGVFWHPAKFATILLEGDPAMLKMFAAKAQMGLTAAKAKWPKMEQEIVKELGAGVAGYIKGMDKTWAKISIKAEGGLLTLKLDAPPLKSIAMSTFFFFMGKDSKRSPEAVKDVKATPVAPPKAMPPRPAVKKPAGKSRRRSTRPARPE
jgi:hypothetical protein